MLVLAEPTVAQLEGFFSFDYLVVMSHFRCIIIMCKFDCFSVVILCISKDASMRAKQLCVLTITESRVKV